MPNCIIFVQKLKRHLARAFWVDGSIDEQKVLDPDSIGSIGVAKSTFPGRLGGKANNAYIPCSSDHASTLRLVFRRQHQNILPKSRKRQQMSL